MSSHSLPHLKNEIVRYCRKLHSAGFVANHEGNITVKLNGVRFLATPTAMSKADVSESDLVIVNPAGKVVEGGRKVFSEISMHLTVYAAREDAGAVVHAHSPCATALAIAGIPLDKPLVPEFVVSVGEEVPIAPFALPGTPLFNENLSKAFSEFDAVMLKNHGVIALGNTVEQAFLRLEHVEQMAKIFINTTLIGRRDELPGDALKELARARKKAGLGREGRKRINF
ncbi:MAG: class II aldolase/adducin family protein [Deltaproteobacteria bacterium]|nr:class II aldolase/adducin family protein [Deltaproteobacteria bacterium]